MENLTSFIPDEIRHRIAFEEGMIFISQELQGDPRLDSAVSRCRKHGIAGFTFLKAADFDSKFRHEAHFSDCRDSEVQGYAKKLIEDAFRKKASDIHIIDRGSYCSIQMRRLGLLQDYAELRGSFGQALMRSIYETMSQSADAVYSTSERQDGRIAKREYLPFAVHSCRLHTEPLEESLGKDGTGAFMAIRLLYDSSEAKGSLETRLGILGHTDSDIAKIRELTQRTGLTIISGPTGHGKSTLLKHVMEAMALENPERNYMSVEDPPEYPLVGVKQVRVSTSGAGGADASARAQAYDNAIAGAMRSDPDVLMIGEIRFSEAASAAIDAALTGHGVWATLHTNNGLGIVRRMVTLLNKGDFANPLEYLCDHNVLAGMIYQRLLPVLCPNCKVPFSEALAHPALSPSGPTLFRMERVLSGVLDNSVFVRGQGCPNCQSMGVVGQTVAAEVIVPDAHLLSLLRKDKFLEASRYWREDLCGKTYVERAWELIRAGQVDPYLAELRLGVPLTFGENLTECAA